MGPNQIYKLLHSKGNHQQNKRQPTDWEKIFANNATDKGLFPKYTNSSYNSTTTTTKKTIKKWAEDLNRYFSKEDIHMANRHMKRCSTLLIIRETQIKTTVRYHLTPVRMTITKKVYRASLVAQWLRICLPMQGTQVRALVWEDPTCRGATKPMSHNYWACASGACALQQERQR